MPKKTPRKQNLQHGVRAHGTIQDRVELVPLLLNELNQKLGVVPDIGDLTDY